MIKLPLKTDNNKKLQEIRDHVLACILPYQAYLLAFSGGLDSTVLLDILATLRDEQNFTKSNNTPIRKLRAIYINHGLNHYSKQWIIHCRQECRQRTINFSTIDVMLNRTKENGIEAAARNARYQALMTVIKEDEVLLVAHHKDDQAETLLLALKRGSGPAGLSAMSVDTLYLGYHIIRPLLNFSRADLEDYANANQLHWINDDSNLNLRFDRNFLRLHILPLLRKRWPQFINTVARSAQLCAEQEKLLDELLNETLNKVITSNKSLYLKPLIMMSEGKRTALLRRWLSSLGLRMLARQQLIRLWKEVVLSRRDAVAQLKIDDWFIRRFKGHLYIVSSLLPIIDTKTILYWSQEDEQIKLPMDMGILYRYILNTDNCILNESFHVQNNSIFFKEKYSSNRKLILNMNTNSTTELITLVRAPLPNEKVLIRFGSVNGLLHIEGRRHGRTLKKILQELNIPPWRRKNIPMLFYNKQLIAALGVFVTMEGSIKEFNLRWQIFYESNNSCY